MLSRVALIGVCFIVLYQPDASEGAVCNPQSAVSQWDTPRCKLVRTTESDFRGEFQKKFESLTALAELLTISNSKHSVNYIKLVRQTGHYLWIEVGTDSAGNYISYDVHDNMPNRGDNRRRLIKHPDPFKELDYRSFYQYDQYYTRNCYITDGADLLIVVKADNKWVNGVWAQSGIPFYKFDKKYELFASLCEKLSDKMR